LALEAVVALADLSSVVDRMTVIRKAVVLCNLFALFDGSRKRET